jgi:hypothetical protein
MIKKLVCFLLDLSAVSSGAASSIIGGGRGGEYSYICVHRPSKQSISKEVNNAEHEDMNIRLPPIIERAAPLAVCAVQTCHCFKKPINAK